MVDVYPKTIIFDSDFTSYYTYAVNTCILSGNKTTKFSTENFRFLETIAIGDFTELNIKTFHPNGFNVKIFGNTVLKGDGPLFPYFDTRHSLTIGKNVSNPNSRTITSTFSSPIEGDKTYKVTTVVKPS